jgi:hypothetical protein
MVQAASRASRLTRPPLSETIKDTRFHASELAIMEPTKELIDAIYRERVLRARATPPAEKFLQGARLFDMVCRIMRDGIRNQYPEADERRIEELLVHRLELARRLEEPSTLFRPVENEQ